MACKGGGYDPGCDNNPQFTDVRLVDGNGNVITSAYPGDIVYIEAKVQGSVFPHCSNYYLIFYGRNAEYLECYQDHVLWSESRWVSHPYGVPNYPGETITLGVLEVLTGKFLSTTLEILVLVMEGEADITHVEAPSEFTPNVQFLIDVFVKNVGETDELFVRILNTDTGEILDEYAQSVPSGHNWLHKAYITLTQTTVFHGRVEAGHEETTSTRKILICQEGYCHV